MKVPVFTFFVLFLNLVKSAISDATPLLSNDLRRNCTLLQSCNGIGLSSGSEETGPFVPQPQLAGTPGFPGLVPEPASDEDWSRYLCKGRKMMAQMSYSDYDVAQLLPTPKTTVQSPWTLADLPLWGYTISDSDQVYHNFEEDGYWGIGTMFRKLQISDKDVDEGGEWHGTTITHWDPHDEMRTSKDKQVYLAPDGHTKRMTGAHFITSINSNNDGGIMTQSRKSPWEALQELHPTDFKSDDLPALQRSSDMMWAMWEKFIEADKRHNLRFFVTLTIENEMTLSLIKRALDNIGQDLTQEGHFFDMSTDEGKALLSSPNGAGFAHFLIERKRQVGLKSIENVLLFQCDGMALSPCMFYTVKDLAAPVPRPSDDAAPPIVPPRPSKDDPNWWTNTNKPRPGIDPPLRPPPPPPPARRAEEKRSIVRRHVMRLDENGKVTVTSSYD